MKKYLSEHTILMQEWDYELNKDLDPTKLTYGSNKKAWWKCQKCNGKWQAYISDRTRVKSTGCPFCAGQKVLKGYNDLATTNPEVVSQWNSRKNGALQPCDVMSGSNKKVWWICSKGHEFEQSIVSRTKHPNSCPICSGQKVAIGINDLNSQYPKVAKEWNYKKNKSDITPTSITWGSNKKFWWVCSECGHEWEARVSDRTRDNNGCPACANKVLIAGVNDLETKFPNIAKEWNYAKNGSLKPSDIKANSLKKVWWTCSKGHDFYQSINLRTTRNHGCPICANQKIKIGYNDLATTYPEIAKEWNYEKNGDLKPTDVVAGSTKKVWWVCSNGHNYEQTIEKRTLRNQSCPYCSGHKVLKGYNDLVTANEILAKEWHPTKNNELTPDIVTSGSGKKVWWLCPVGHEYQATIHDRNQGTNCPICNARHSTSFPEQAIYFYIKQAYPDTLNKYREIFDNSMELDIYIPSKKIAIEYDGVAWHKTIEQHNREIKKYNICKEKGIYLIRVKEHSNHTWNDVSDLTYYVSKRKRNNFENLENTIKSIFEQIDKNKKVKIDINSDKNSILNYLSKIENSLLEKRPDVAEKWNYKKNGKLRPDMFSVSSNEIVWWQCPECGNEWENSINAMTREGRYGCPICANKQSGISFTKGIVKKVGSLAEAMPELAKEWHPEKNGDLTPYDITAGRFKPVWWLCPKCGYEWQASPNLRKKGIGCPCCSGRVPKMGVNDLETTHPEIAKEWNYEKNGDLKPSMYKAGSGKKVWWICPTCGNEYQARIGRRTSKDKPTGCPICGHKKGAKSCSFKVNMYDIQTKELIKSFSSITEACKIMHLCRTTISQVCKGQRQQAGGYFWSYADN